MSSGKKWVPRSSRPHNEKAEIFKRYIRGMLHILKQVKKKVFGDFWQNEGESLQESCGQTMKQNLKMPFKKLLLRCKKKKFI